MCSRERQCLVSSRVDREDLSSLKKKLLKLEGTSSSRKKEGQGRSTPGAEQEKKAIPYPRSTLLINMNPDLML